MDFIERLFQISPDGGSGSLEFLVLLIPLIFAYRWVRSVLAGNRSRSIH
jgi:hypothetical protein